MIQEEIGKFLIKFNEEITEARNFCYFVRAIEFQKKFIRSQDEENANMLLACILLVKSVYSELEMWIALKESDESAAWDSLINAEDSITASIKAHNIAEQWAYQMSNLHALEVLLFPPQKFSSAGYIIHKSECAICGLDYQQCEHIMGKPYMGKLCSRKIISCDLLEVSVVENPANKRCRISSFGDGNIMRDVMTWKSIEK